MILNIVDRRTSPHRWKVINAIIEATWHDNATPGADYAEQDYSEPGFAGWRGISLSEAVIWALSFEVPLPLYLYDRGSGAVSDWPARMPN